MKELLAQVEQAFQLPLHDPIIVFSLILFIILLAPLLLKRLNIPGLIGLILSGIVIGPYGLHLIDGMENDSAVDLFSTIGLLYIMFIAGLELDLNQFKANRNKSLLFGFFTFSIPLTIGYFACHYLLGYDFNASFLTASMFATHTLVAYPIVSKMGTSKDPSVAITVGGTILTDTAVLIILAVIVGNSKGSLTSAFWIRLVISLTLFTAIMFLIIPRIARWFFRKLESEKHSHYIFVLSVVFFAAFLAEAAGVEAIIGAFVAGLALNSLIPTTSALMNRIEFMGNSLFIPFFLISVGMLVDVSVITHGIGAWIIAGVLTTVAIFGKWMAALLTQLTFKFSRAQRQMIFGLSSAHAAATLAVIIVGHKEGIIDDNILNGTIILILITSIVASFATEKASKKIILASETNNVYNEDAITSEHILMPIENVNKIGNLLEFSVMLKDKSSENPISVLNVVSNNEEAETNIIKAKSKLEGFVKEASATETAANVITTIDHNVATGISRVSREIQADMIILGWPHHSGFFDKLIGSKMESILEKTYKTTVICNFQQPLAIHKNIKLFVTPLAESEIGFKLWVTKVAKLSGELSAPISIYCSEDTLSAFQNVLNERQLSPALKSTIFTDWDDFLAFSKYIEENDLLILVSARKKSLSFIPILESIPSKLERYFSKNNYIVIYPRQFSMLDEGDIYSDISSEPLDRSIEVVQKIGKGIGSIFKKEGDK